MPASRVVVVYGAADGIIRRVIAPDTDAQLQKAIPLRPGEIARAMIRSLYVQCRSHAEIAKKLGLNG